MNKKLQKIMGILSFVVELIELVKRFIPKKNDGKQAETERVEK